MKSLTRKNVLNIFRKVTECLNKLPSSDATMLSEIVEQSMLQYF
jgi:hypothetical protein